MKVEVKRLQGKCRGLQVKKLELSSEYTILLEHRPYTAAERMADHSIFGGVAAPSAE